MSSKPKPKPCYLDKFEVVKVVGKRKIHADPKRTRYYTWDGMHGEIEVFDRNGFHLAALNAITGIFKKPAVKGRKINLK